MAPATPAATYIREFGGGGSGAGQFSAPGGVTTDPEGNIWVADTGHNRIQQFDPEGEFLSQFGGAGLLAAPRGIAIDPEGNVVVADSGHDRVKVFTPKGELVRSIGEHGSTSGKFNALRDVAVDPEGNIWTLETVPTKARVQEFNSKGEFIRSFGSVGTGNGQFDEPQGIATDAEGNVWVADTDNNRVQQFNPKGEFIRKFGTVGAGNGQFKAPSALNVDAEGNVWVADSGNNRVQELTAEGTYLSQFGKAGNDDGQFSEPQGINVDAEGNVWVADTGNDRVQEIAASEFVLEFGGEGSGAGQLSAPSEVATDSEGDVWVADTVHNRIQQFDSEGEFISQFGAKGEATGLFDRPHGIAIDSEDNIWVADSYNDRIQQFDAEGEFIASFGSRGTGNGKYHEPFAIAIDSEDNVWIADTFNNRIQELNSKGEFIRKFGSVGSENSQFKEPQGIAIDSKGNVWIADSGNHRIKQTTYKGEYIRKFGSEGSGNGQLMAPSALSFDSEGDLWVADTGNDRLQEFDDEGTYLSQFGAWGHEDGQFAEPRGLAIDAEGNVWIADTGNDRVQEVAAGEFVQSFGGGGSEAGLLSEPASIATDAQGNVWVADTAHARIQQFDSEGAFVRKFGNLGTEDGQFEQPLGIAVDPEGNVWVTDHAANRVQEFSSKGKFIRKFGSEGYTDGKFRYPWGVAADAEGNVWVVDTGNDRVQVFNPKGEFKEEFGSEGTGNGQFKEPRGIAIDEEGNAWIADSGNDRIQQFNSKGEFIRKFGTAGTGAGQLESPTSVGIDPEGNVWAADTSNDRVQRFDPKGKYLGQFGSPGDDPGQLSGPMGVTLDSNGRIWVADTANDRVQEWLISGYTLSYLSAFGSQGAGSGQFEHPADVALDAEGDIWVVDRNNDRIQEFSETGEYIRKFGSSGAGNGRFDRPAALALDDEGNVWVADSGNNRIQKLSAEGEYLDKFGSGGKGDGQFSRPEGIAIDADGDIWVSDTHNGRLQEFDEEGEFIKAVSSHGSEEGQLGEPTGIDIDSSGNVWVADWQNNRISEFDEDGDFVRQFGSAGSGNGQFASPDALAIDDRDNVWIGDEGNNRIQKFSRTGRYLTQFGTEGTGEGQFSFGWPMGIAVSSEGDIWVTDSENNRVQRWWVSTGPNTAMTDGPEGVVVPNVSFSFTSNEAGSGFECSLDEAAFSACISPAAYEGLAEGPHIFQVRAKSMIGTDETPAERDFEVIDAAKATAAVPLLDDLEREEVPFETGNWSQTGWVEEIGGAWMEGYRGFGSSGGLAGAYWSPTYFRDGGATVLVSAAIGTEAPEEDEYLALWLDMPSPGSTQSGYEARFIGVDGSSSNYEAELAKWDAGTRTVLASASEVSLAPETVITLSETAGGSLALWTGSGTMSPLLTASDSTYTGGYAGLEVNGGEGTVYNFRAGQIGVEPPAATTMAATGVHGGEATLNAEVNPNGSETTYHFEYATEADYEEHGFETATRVPASPEGIGSGTEDEEVNETVEGLEPSTTYHFRISAMSKAGITFGADQALRTLGVPTAITSATSGVSASEATLNAEVNPNGSETTYQFEYATEADYEEHGFETATRVPASPEGIGSGTEDEEVNETVEGLEPGTTYYARIAAENAEGAVAGEDVKFTTSSVIKSLPTCEELEATTTSGEPISLSLECKGSGKLTYEVDSEPEHGSISEFSSSAGTLKYTPAAEFGGTDSFTFLASNANGPSKAATATINVCGSPEVEVGGDVTEPETPGVNLWVDASLGCQEGGEEPLVAEIRIYIDEELIYTEDLQCEKTEELCRISIERGIQLPYAKVIGTHEYRAEAVDQLGAEMAASEWSETTPEEGTISQIPPEAEDSKGSPGCETPKNRYKEYFFRGKTVYGTPCADILGRYAGTTIYKAGASDDVIRAGGEINQIEGGEGDDRIYTRRGNDKVFGGTGSDKIFSGSGDDIVIGNGGGDTLVGSGGSDQIFGNDGDDFVMGGPTVDHLNGGSGTNTLSFADAVTPGFEFGTGFLSGFPSAASGRGLYVNLGEESKEDKEKHNYTRAFNGSTARFGGGSDRLYIDGGSFQNVIGSPFADVIVGSGEANLIDGGGGPDIIEGAGGDDELYGGADSDLLDGGEGQSAGGLHGGDGDDICVNGAEGTPCERDNTGKGLSPTSAGVIVVGRLNPDDPTYDTGIFLRGSSWSDNVTATWDGGHEKEVNNVVKFVVSGGEGTGRFDTAANGVSGCAVTETEAACPLSAVNTVLMDGGDGNDVLKAHSFPVTVAVTLLGGPGRDILHGSGTSEDTLVDGPDGGNDDLYGFGGDDTLFANEGRDRLYGAAGSDLFVSSWPCRDRIDGGGDARDIDNASWAQIRGEKKGDSGQFEKPVNGAEVSLPQKPNQLGSISRFGGGCGNEAKGTIKGIEFLEGSSGKDRLEADGSHNVVLGRSGKDRLIGLGGNDNLLANNRDPEGVTEEEKQDPDAALNCGGGGEDTLLYDQGYDKGDIISGCEHAHPGKATQSSVVSGIGSEPTAEAETVGLDEYVIGGAGDPEANRPLGFFRLDEVSGTEAENSMREKGEAETGTYAGGATLGEPGAMEESSAVHLDGENDYLSLTTFWEPYVVPGVCAQHLYGYSMEMWVKFDSPPSGRETLFSRVKGGNGIDVYRSEDGRLNFTVYKPWGESPTTRTDESVSDEEWHHVVATGQYYHYCKGDSGPWAPPQLRLYVDGFAYPLYFERGYYPLTENTLSEPNLVGARNSGGGLTDWLEGTVDDVAIYRYPLSEGEVKAHMAIGDALDPPALLVPPVDPEDGDGDEDGVLDSVDNCPATSNPEQADADGDGVGDACQEEPDADEDEVPDEDDNCPEVANKEQADSDGNGVGDACEPE